MKILYKIIIIVLVIVMCIGIGVKCYFYLKDLQKSKLEKGTKTVEQAGSTAEKITESATQGALPSIGANPLENKPNVNPVDTANPFKNIKINPFE